MLSAPQALALWRGALAASLRSGGPDLTSRQAVLLLTVYLTEPPHTVRGLAADLAISKAAVSRALDRLSKLGFVRRRVDEADRRSVLVHRTGAGDAFLAGFAGLIVASAAEATEAPATAPG
jgi:DNA-binding MarR family transcriptional regulator